MILRLILRVHVQCTMRIRSQRLRRLLLHFTSKPALQENPVIRLTSHSTVFRRAPTRRDRANSTLPVQCLIVTRNTYIFCLCPLQDTDMCHYITLTELFPVNAYSVFKYVPRCVIVPDDDFSAVWAHPHPV